MARPIKADAARTQQRILSAAVALFGERGLDGVSVRAIGAAAGVSLATVHHYFGSKDALYRACVDAMYEELLSMQPQLADAIREGAPACELIDRTVRRAFRFGRARQVELRLLMREVMAAGELPDERRERGQVPFLDQIPALLGATDESRAAEIRLSLQSIAFLITRYATSSERELELFTGRSGEDALAMVEDHIVGVATSLFEE